MAILEEVLDLVPIAVALMAAGGRVVRANPVARRLLSVAQGMALTLDDRLVFSDNAARDALAEALVRCSGALHPMSKDDDAEAKRILVPRENRAPVSMTLHPLARRCEGATGAIAVLFMSDPEAVPCDRTALLRAAYGLTSTECRLVQALAAGISLKEFAQRNVMSYETARSHIRRILSKTGSRKQADLVAIVCRLR